MKRCIVCNKKIDLNDHEEMCVESDERKEYPVHSICFGRFELPDYFIIWAACKRKPTFKRYHHIITKSKRWKESDIVAFRSLLNGMIYTKLTRYEVGLLHELFNDNLPYKITREQTTKGINWLRRVCFKLNGQPRKSCPLDGEYLNIIRKFRRFEFVALVNCSTNLRGYYLPEYRVIDKDGNAFDYYYSNWREGTLDTSHIFNIKEGV